MNDFDYKKVFTLPEAFLLMEQYREKAGILAGGTDLLVKMQMRTRPGRPDILIDLKGIPDFGEIRFDPANGLRLGALTPIHSLETSSLIREKFGVISQAAGFLGSFQIRTRATLGGNLCTASPAGDMAPCLITLGAKARIAGPKGEREVLLEDFFLGPGKNLLQPGELLVGIEVPCPPPFSAFRYAKHTIRKAMDLAIVGVAVGLSFEAGKDRCREVRIALGAVGPVPLRARGAEAQIRGGEVDDGAIAQASRLASEEILPVSDIRASGEYRREMVRVLVQRVLKDVREDGSSGRTPR
jgi:carbon-monoxide dehydrogenase medium subunit